MRLGGDIKNIHFKGHQGVVSIWDEIKRYPRINFMADNIERDFPIGSYKAGIEGAPWTLVQGCVFWCS